MHMLHEDSLEVVSRQFGSIPASKSASTISVRPENNNNDKKQQQQPTTTHIMQCYKVGKWSSKAKSTSTVVPDAIEWSIIS